MHSSPRNLPVEIVNQLFIIATDKVVEETLMNSIQCQQVAGCKRLWQKQCWRSFSNNRKRLLLQSAGACRTVVYYLIGWPMQIIVSEHQAIVC